MVLTVLHLIQMSNSTFDVVLEDENADELLCTIENVTVPENIEWLLRAAAHDEQISFCSDYLNEDNNDTSTKASKDISQA